MNILGLLFLLDFILEYSFLRCSTCVLIGFREGWNGIANFLRILCLFGSLTSNDIGYCILICSINACSHCRKSSLLALQKPGMRFGCSYLPYSPHMREEMTVSHSFSSWATGMHIPRIGQVWFVAKGSNQTNWSRWCTGPRVQIAE